MCGEGLGTREALGRERREWVELRTGDGVIGLIGWMCGDALTYQSGQFLFPILQWLTLIRDKSNSSAQFAEPFTLALVDGSRLRFLTPSTSTHLKATFEAQREAGDSGRISTYCTPPPCPVPPVHCHCLHCFVPLLSTNIARILYLSFFIIIILIVFNESCV